MQRVPGVCLAMLFLFLILQATNAANLTAFEEVLPLSCTTTLESSYIKFWGNSTAHLMFAKAWSKNNVLRGWKFDDENITKNSPSKRDVEEYSIPLPETPAKHFCVTYNTSILLPSIIRVLFGSKLDIQIVRDIFIYPSCVFSVITVPNVPVIDKLLIATKYTLSPQNNTLIAVHKIMHRQLIWAASWTKAMLYSTLTESIKESSAILLGFFCN